MDLEPNSNDSKEIAGIIKEKLDDHKASDKQIEEWE